MVAVAVVVVVEKEWTVGRPSIGLEDDTKALEEKAPTVLLEVTNVANHKGGQENSCRRMVYGILELVKSRGGMLAMVVVADGHAITEQNHQQDRQTQK